MRGPAIGTLLVAYLGLMGLLALTWSVYYVDLGVFNTVVALAVAVAKTLLVVLFFMEVGYRTAATRVVSAAGFIWLSILLFLTAADYLSRLPPIVWHG